MCPFDYTTSAVSRKVGISQTGLTKPVGWLSSLQLTVLSRSLIVVSWKILVAFLCWHIAFFFKFSVGGFCHRTESDFLFIRPLCKIQKKWCTTNVTQRVIRWIFKAPLKSVVWPVWNRNKCHECLRHNNNTRIKQYTDFGAILGIIWRAVSKPPQRRRGPDLRPLWLLVGTPSAIGPELASRRAEHSLSYSDVTISIFAI